MAEQRLIDANNLGVGKANPDAFERKDYAYGWNSALQAVTEASPTVDPESLLIVRQLREELARVKVERDDYKELFLSYRNVCGCHDPQRISELVEADKDGRCVVLPSHEAAEAALAKEAK